MIELFYLSLAILVGYLLGSLNTAVIVGKVYGTDIRQSGSKSAGLTNTLRVLGKSAALIVLAGDILKGVVACLIGLYLGESVAGAVAKGSVCLLAAGTGAVIGHNWPVYFRFKGGKGALTAAAVMFMFDWALALMALALFVLVIAVTRYVSLGTLSATVCFIAFSFLPGFEKGLYFYIFTCFLAMVIIVKHRENIARLLSGSENKLSF